MSTSNNVDLTDTKSAFATFFNTKDGKTTKSSVKNNPVDKILGKASVEVPPTDKRVITKVDSSNESVSEEAMSVDDAEMILNTRKDFGEILKELKINYSDLFKIIDATLEKGYYEEHYRIKSFEFVLRTKRVHSISTIEDALDGAKYASPSAVGQFLLERNLAASLVYYKQGNSAPRIFEHNNDKDDEIALAFVKNELHVAPYAMMVNKLRKFELYVGLATREEAIDHFLAHTQD
jgi:hypothetical protein